MGLETGPDSFGLKQHYIHEDEPFEMTVIISILICN